jgi:hypothetical protein
MKGERGRNRQQPEYLNEKDAAEDRQGNTAPNKDHREHAQEENEEQRSTAIGVRNAFVTEAKCGTKRNWRLPFAAP